MITKYKLKFREVAVVHTLFPFRGYSPLQLYACCTPCMLACKCMGACTCAHVCMRACVSVRARTRTVVCLICDTRPLKYILFHSVYYILICNLLFYYVLFILFQMRDSPLYYITPEKSKALTFAYVWAFNFFVMVMPHDLCADYSYKTFEAHPKCMHPKPMPNMQTCHGTITIAWGVSTFW